MPGYEMSYYKRFLPAPVNGGFRSFRKDGKEYGIWCGSVIQGEDGRYQMFASAIPQGGIWMLDSVVVRGSADTPEGPYRFEEFVLPARGAQYWDGLMTHNPCIQKCGDTYILYYTGTTYQGTSHDLENENEGWGNKRIGVATSKSVAGPWKRNDKPILDVRAGKWDSVITSNAAPCVHVDGSVLLIYKSSAIDYKTNITTGLDLRLGAAWADHYDGPYRRITEEPLLYPDKSVNLEDAYVWKGKDGYYHMLTKVFEEGERIMGEGMSGLHAVSLDGKEWKLAEDPIGYLRTVKWDDGTQTKQPRLERVQVLFQDGKPTHFFFATVFDGQPAKSGNICVPLR